MTEQSPADRLAAIRFDYDSGELDEAAVPDDPLVAVRAWVGAAIDANEAEPTAMIVATVGADGTPSARTVLLKAIDGGGLVFFTNRRSRKGRQLADNPHCAAVLRWDLLHRQITVRGRAEEVDDAAADTYFASRPRSSQIGAWASRQSEVIPSRSALDDLVVEAEHRFPGEVPRPPFWGGFRIVPAEVELWQGRPSRLHDRIRWRRAEADWIVERLSP